MTTDRQCPPLVPRQPLLVLASDRYYKLGFGKFGISHFYTFRVKPDRFLEAQVVPDGTVDIIFHCGRGTADAFCYGTRLCARTLQQAQVASSGDAVFGVRFLQGQAYLPGKIPASELTERAVSLPELMGDTALAEQICASADFMEQVRLFLRGYVRQYYGQEKDRAPTRLAQYMMRRIVASRGTLHVEALCEEMAFSQRYLNQTFRDFYGQSPKSFSKMVRFQHILSQLPQRSSLTAVAMEAGYYDQAHLIHEFKQMMGRTPKQYLRALQEADCARRLVVLPGGMQKLPQRLLL